MNTTMDSKMLDHGRKLLAVFPNAAERDPVKLCKKLRQMEHEAHQIALRSCNGPVWTEEQLTAACSRVLSKVETLLGCLGDDDSAPEIWVNLDARGYALKIGDEDMKARNIDLHRDWGGNGIIAPNLSE